MTRWKAIGFTLVFLVPAQMPLAAWLGARTGWVAAMCWFPLVFLFVLLPAMDYALGHDPANVPADAERSTALHPWFRALTLLALPVHLGLLAWSGWWFANTTLGWAGAIGWLLSQGLVGGILAINTAHELIHKDAPVERLAGGLLLASVGYHGFKVEHLRGHHVHVATPKGFELPDEVADQAAEVAYKGAGLTEFTDPKAAVRDVDAIYTDVWTSMGQEVEYAERKKTFKRYQVNEAMMALAKPGALFMHCLPAHRGEEVSDEVIESPISVVFDQAENRLHAQKALLIAMLKD